MKKFDASGYWFTIAASKNVLKNLEKKSVTPNGQERSDYLSFCQVFVGEEELCMGQTVLTTQYNLQTFLRGLTFAILISCSHCLVQSWAIIILIGVCWTIKACVSLLSPPQIPQSRLVRMQPTLHTVVYLLFCKGKTAHCWSSSSFPHKTRSPKSCFFLQGRTVSTVRLK